MKFIDTNVMVYVADDTDIVWGLWDVVRRWREVAEIQRMVGEMSDEERKEFYSAAEEGDVELAFDKNGGTHSTPLDFG